MTQYQFVRPFSMLRICVSGVRKQLNSALLKPIPVPRPGNPAGRVASKLNTEFRPEDVERRVRAKARMAEDPMLGLAQAVIMIGPEHAPEGHLGASTWEALFS